MSADSPRRGVHKGAQVVSPQPIVDRSIIDSVAGIINDIVPQAYAGAPTSDNKESISWARFEYADINDPAIYPDYNEGSSTPPLLLVLGYTTGVQVWLIPATGEATEVLSWRQGVVRTLRILPNPKTDDEHVDPFEPKRPMVAICDSAGPGPQFCNISFISLKSGEQAKSIKFKNPVCDVLANRRSVVVTFLEKIAVFDARTLEDVITVTTCYASPGPNPNPVALGRRWLAYSEKKLLPARRSSGGCEGEGVQSYTATVLYAAKSLGKGLRGLGETVASSLTGNSVSPIAINNLGNDVTQPGVVTILDLQAAKEEKELDDIESVTQTANIETVIAHFTAHSDAIVAMTFDLSGALLMTADKRGHDFHVFRIQPHPGGPTLAAVHHLYILHRGDTTAKVQDMTFSSDTRWAAISTVRGTTHVFPVAPYGGPVGVRTHSTPHVVNRLSRFHRSAGLTDDGTRSHSPVSHTELPLSVYPYSNPRLPPYPHPTILNPLAQIRQPYSLNHGNTQAQPSRPQPRQRLHSDDSGSLPLKICACFAPPRAWIYAQRESSTKVMKRAVDSLFIMACHGNMIQYDLEPKPAAGVPKEKVCDDTMIELEVEAKGQWPLMRTPNSLEIVPPLSLSSPLLSVSVAPKNVQELDSTEDRWLSQVEIVTHAGPHRRLWMGPQFVFKTYNAPSGVAVNLVEAEAVEIGVTGGSRPARSNPVNMPHAASRPSVPVVIDGSGSSYEQSPRFMEAYGDPLDSENVGMGSGENQLREDLAEAMLETSITPHRAPGRRSVFERVGQPVTKVVNPLGTVITVSADEEDVSSSQEFDSAEEGLVPEPPRSVCAEEGPASLGDVELESQTLRDLTEICAEMRSASEPAIDSVPDENIREVKERRALCVEMLATTSGKNRSSIDFEREEAFRDVPTTLSLCAERGEVPNSPMTQAKKQACWRRAANRRDETELVHRRNVAKAKYVVSYDDDSVVLMESQPTTSTSTCVPTAKKSFDRIESETSSGQQPRKTRSARPFEPPRRVERYILNEHEDSIVIEDIRGDMEKKAVATKKEKVIEDTTKETHKQKSKNSKTRDSLKASESSREENAKEESKLSCKLAELSDDLTSMEYHIVEPGSSRDTASSNHSDIEDIEHIQTCDLIQRDGQESSARRGNIEENVIGDNIQRVLEFSSSPNGQRKNSKSTISDDDDLEYIHKSELSEQEGSSRPNEKRQHQVAKQYHHSALLSDDDLEHVLHSDVSELAELEITSSRSKTARRRKDHHVVVIESDASAEAEVTVIAKPLESGSRNKTLERGDGEEATTTAATAMATAVDRPDTENPSPVRKGKSRTVKTNFPQFASKRPQTGVVEIIDIDAMQKAEVETPPECKILPPRHENNGRSGRKSRKNRKSQSEAQDTSAETVQVSKVKMAELQEAVEESLLESKWQEKPQTDTTTATAITMTTTTTTTTTTATTTATMTATKTISTTEMSWSAIVKRKGAPAAEELKKELDLEPLIEVEEKTESEEKENDFTLEGIKRETDTTDSCEFLDKATVFDVGTKATINLNKSRNRGLGEKSLLEDDVETTTSTATATTTTITRTATIIGKTTGNEIEEISKNKKVLEETRKNSRGEAEVEVEEEEEEGEEEEGEEEEEDVEEEEEQSPPADSTSSKENSPEPGEKRSDSEQESCVPDRSSSSDEMNETNAMPISKDRPAREVEVEVEFEVERSHCTGSIGGGRTMVGAGGGNTGANGTTSLSSSVAKKGSRSKKKKRR